MLHSKLSINCPKKILREGKREKNINKVEKGQGNA